MKTLKHLGMASMLTLVFTLPALAGEIHVPGPPPPEPPPGSSSAAPGQTETPGDAATPGITQTPGLASVEEVALNLLQSMLSVF